MNDKESLERTKELAKVQPVGEPEFSKPKSGKYEEEPVEEVKEEPREEKEVEVKETKKEQVKEEPPKEYDKTKHNRLMMDFDAHDIDEDSPKAKKETKRNIILLFVLVICLISVICLIIFFLNKNPIEQYDYKYYTEKAVYEIYATDDNKTLKEVLDKIKNKDEEVEYLQTTSKKIIYGWLNDLISDDFANQKEFLTKANKIKTDINLVNSTTIDNKVSIKKEDYESSIKRLNSIIEDGTIFYQAINIYNTKDYNEAFRILRDIAPESEFYVKVTKTKEKILDSFFEDLQKELDNIQIIYEEDNQTALNLLNSYITKYNYLQLDKNTKFKEIMDRYRG